MAVDARRPEGTAEASDGALCAHFASARPDLDAPAGLGAALRAALEAARTAWPEVDLPAEPFVRFLAEKLPAGAPAERSLAALHASDLYLTCAAARGDARALSCFERLCTPVVGWACARLGASAEQTREVGQQVSQHLLAPPRLAADGPARPYVAEFSGRGSLSAWLRVVSMREALEVVRRQRRELPADDSELARRLEPDAGPELAYFKRLYRDEFKVAFAEALAALSRGERTLLRQHALDGMSIDRLATFYGIHRSTAARRLDAARRAALKHTRQALNRRLRLEPDEFESVMRLIKSQLDISLSPLRGNRAGPGGRPAATSSPPGAPPPTKRRVAGRAGPSGSQT